MDAPKLATDPTGLDWVAAASHLAAVLDAYKELLGQPNVIVGPQLAMLEGLNFRLARGERTQEFFDEIMGWKL